MNNIIKFQNKISFLFIFLIVFLVNIQLVFATDITEPTYCCDNLELVCENIPCVDCGGECVKKIDNKYYSCSLKNPSKYIDTVLKSDDFKNFIENRLVSFTGAKHRIQRKNRACNVEIATSFKINADLGEYTGLLLFDVTSNNPIIKFKEMTYEDILTAIELAENNERVRYWIKKYPNSKGNFNYIGSGSIKLQYGGPENLLIYLYKYVVQEGIVQMYSAPLDDLPEFEEVKISLQNPEIKETIDSKIYDSFTAEYKDNQTWGITLFKPGPALRKEFTINVSNKKVDIPLIKKGSNNNKKIGQPIFLILSLIVFTVGMIFYLLKKRR